MIRALREVIESYPSLLVGFSGGVDSTFLAVVGTKVLGRDRCLAVTGVSPSLSAAQAGQAERLATMFDLRWRRVVTGEFDDPDYIANSANRCFFCKQELWGRLRLVAAEEGMAVIADGTHAGDLAGHRPGAVAGRNASVRSPLAEAGLSKEDIRREAKRLGIPIWDAPASPCLSSRIQYGLTVTPGRVEQVASGEGLLRSLGITGDLRVRHRGSEARIEVHPSQFAAVRSRGDAISTGLLASGFTRVTLDLNGYRSGSLLQPDDATVEVLARVD